MDMGPTYEAFRISSGNSFVHETESQGILNGSRDISFTMDLVSKDIGLFQSIAERAGVPLEMNPLMIDIFKDGEARYGSREFSPNIIRRLEDAHALHPLTDFISIKSNSPQRPPSRPLPDALMPPNGAPAAWGLPFISTIPERSFLAIR